MTKKVLFVMLLCLLVPSLRVSAEESAPATDTQTKPAAVEPAAAVQEPAVPAPAAVAEPAAAASAAGEAAVSENLEFVSGEVLSADEAAKTVTVKLYGETESQVSDKTITVTVDDTTDVTDGEKSRDLKSLTANTEVDVEYDPATNKATYIFVY